MLLGSAGSKLNLTLKLNKEAVIGIMQKKMTNEKTVQECDARMPQQR
jgi:hypothetical protein